ncbi:MAG TPA: hypothetical protein VM010_07490 [Chitinophagaceae bacterium]|nr:hypothetical protein [Chitinophagaceae bacterium]
MQPDKKETNEPQASKPLSETISNAHSSGDGSLRLSEDGLIEPSGETIADAEANKEAEINSEEY